jgi:hypothetical protein
MSTRNLPGGKGRPARKADNLTVICEPTIYKMWSLYVSQSYGTSRPVTGIALLFLYPEQNGKHKLTELAIGATSHVPRE